MELEGIQGGYRDSGINGNSGTHPRTFSMPPEPHLHLAKTLKRSVSSEVKSKKLALKRVLTESDLRNVQVFDAPSVDPVEEKFREGIQRAHAYKPPCALKWLHWLIAPAKSKMHKKVFGSRSRDTKLIGGMSLADHWLIHPESYFRLAWQILMMFVLIVNCFTLPVSIAFFVHVKAHWIEWNAFCDTVFWLDIVISLRTGYVIPLEDVTVMDSRKVCLNYLKRWFVFDFVGVLPVCYILGDLNESGVEDVHYADGRVVTSARLVKLFDLLKVLRIFRLLRYYKASHEVSSTVVSFLKYLRLFVVMFLVCHWNGCLNFYVPALLHFPENSWVLLGNVQNKDWFEQYTNALLKSVSAMITTGYGVNAPVILSEVIIMNWCLISSSVVYGVFIGHTISIISGLDSSGKQYGAQIQKVQEFMASQRIPATLRERIIGFYDFKYRGKLFNEDEIISQLSGPLKEEVVSHTRETLMKTVPLLANLHSEFVTDIVSGLRPEVFQPGDEIITAGARGHAMYFLTEGLAEVTTEDGFFVTKLTDGAFFGEIALITGKKRTATIHALTHCRAYSLSKESFDEIFELHPEMKKMLALKSLKRIRKLSKLSEKTQLLAHMDAIYKIVNGILDSERASSTGASGQQKRAQF